MCQALLPGAGDTEFIEFLCLEVYAIVDGKLVYKIVNLHLDEEKGICLSVPGSKTDQLGRLSTFPVLLPSRRRKALLGFALDS